MRYPIYIYAIYFSSNLIFWINPSIFWGKKVLSKILFGYFRLNSSKRFDYTDRQSRSELLISTAMGGFQCCNIWGMIWLSLSLTTIISFDCFISINHIDRSTDHPYFSFFDDHPPRLQRKKYIIVSSTTVFHQFLLSIAFSQTQFALCRVRFLSYSHHGYEVEYLTDVLCMIDVVGWSNIVGFWWVNSVH